MGHWKLDTGAGNCNLDNGPLNTEHWTLHTSYSTLDTVDIGHCGHWTLGTGQWPLGTGHETMCIGHWTLDTVNLALVSGQSTLGTGH